MLELMSEHHVIYVPGLGDAKMHGQALVVKLWRLFGMRGHVVPMWWATGKALEPKLKRLLDKVDELVAAGHEVSLVGSSAGASAVLLAFAQRHSHISGVVCICGKIQHPETINPMYFKVNPAFKTALEELQDVLPTLAPAVRYRIMSIHPLRDDQVPPADTIIRGAREKTIWTSGHVFSIAVALTLFAPSIMRFLKRQTIELHREPETAL